MYEEEHLSIREIGERMNRSYGAVHKLLADDGVVFRARGNPKAPR